MKENDEFRLVKILKLNDMTMLISHNNVGEVYPRNKLLHSLPPRNPVSSTLTILECVSQLLVYVLPIPQFSSLG